MMIRQILLGCLVLCAAICLCLCQRSPNAPNPTGEPVDGPFEGQLSLPGDLVFLSFSERDSYNKRVQGYEFRREDGRNTAYFWMANEDEPYPVPVDQAWTDQLTDIVRVNNLILWDGFSETDSILLDGTSFHLSFTFSDGTNVSASGYGSFPAGYGGAANQIDAHFLKLLPEKMRTW